MMWWWWCKSYCVLACNRCDQSYRKHRASNAIIFTWERRSYFHLNNPQKKNTDRSPRWGVVVHVQVPLTLLSIDLINKTILQFYRSQSDLSKYHINKLGTEKEGPCTSSGAPLLALKWTRLGGGGGVRGSLKRKRGGGGEWEKEPTRMQSKDSKKRGISKVLHFSHSMWFSTPCANLPKHWRNILKAEGLGTTSIYRASRAFSSTTSIRTYSVSSFLLQSLPWGNTYSHNLMTSGIIGRQ